MFRFYGLFEHKIFLLNYSVQNSNLRARIDNFKILSCHAHINLNIFPFPELFFIVSLIYSSLGGTIFYKATLNTIFIYHLISFNHKEMVGELVE